MFKSKLFYIIVGILFALIFVKCSGKKPMPSMMVCSSDVIVLRYSQQIANGFEKIYSPLEWDKAKNQIQQDFKPFEELLFESLINWLDPPNNVIISDLLIDEAKKHLDLQRRESYQILRKQKGEQLCLYYNMEIRKARLKTRELVLQIQILHDAEDEITNRLQFFSETELRMQAENRKLEEMMREYEQEQEFWRQESQRIAREDSQQQYLNNKETLLSKELKKMNKAMQSLQE